jgi:very-short-patch-repair endonuclease
MKIQSENETTNALKQKMPGKILSPQTDMFYGAMPKIFERARELRKNMTNAEKLLWGKIKKKQVAGLRFRRQHPVNKFIVDFYCHSEQLVIEVDGGIHEHRDQREYDKAREGDLENFGIKVLRFKNKEVENRIEEVVEKIKKQRLFHP